MTIKPLYWLRGIFIVCSALAWVNVGRAATAGTTPKPDAASSHTANSLSRDTLPDRPETHDLGVMVIVGKRASLASAQEIKREKTEIVDAVVGDDINKLPDANVTEALQRVTGVQVLRDRGEGAGVAIRGLTQMETTPNGREVFTAGIGRALDFATFRRKWWEASTSGRVSARLACNWRDKFLSGIANIVGVGMLPVYTKGYGWLDASLRFRVSHNVILALEDMNLLGTQRTSYYGVETQPQAAWVNDWQFSAAATVRL